MRISCDVAVICSMMFPFCKSCDAIALAGTGHLVHLANEAVDCVPYPSSLSG